MREQGLITEPVAKLLDTIGRLSRARTIDDVTRCVRVAARQLTGADGVTFVLRDEGQCYYVDEDAIAPLWRGKRFPMEQCISGWCMLHAEQVVIEDIYRDDRIPVDAYKVTFVKSLAMVPIRSEDPIGAIGAYWAERHAATDGELEVLQVLADFTSMALSNVELLSQLERSERRYRAIVDDQTEMIVRWKPGGIRTYANEAYARFFNVPSEQLIGRSFFELIPEEWHPFVRAKIAKITPENPSQTEVHRAVTTDGRTVWTEWTDRGIFDDAGNIVEYQSVGRDVTHRKHLEAQLMQSQKIESLGRLAGGVAHDLNNLLMPILSYSELLLDDLPGDDPHREAIDTIRTAGGDARDLVRQLLAFGRQQVLDRRYANLNRLVTAFRPIIARTLRADIRLNVRLDATPAAVCVDTAQVRQVLLNLVINAADAMPDGGTLTIETTRRHVVDADDEARDQPLDIDAGDYLVLSVTDTGTGMDAQTLDRIFEPFFTTKPPGSGTGLGLATCYGIVRQHGGRLRVTSEPGRGSTFDVYLPADDASDADVAEQSEAAAVGSGAKPTREARDVTILVAEDSRVVRTLVVKILEREGYAVLECEHAAAAIDRVAAHDGPIDLLLTDVVMPDMTGDQLHKRLIRHRPDLPVVYMSGYTSDAVDDAALRGARFLQKPFHPQTLLRTIVEALG